MTTTIYIYNAIDADTWFLKKSMCFSQTSDIVHVTVGEEQDANYYTNI